MALNSYFLNSSHATANEQGLMDSLIIESIQIFGVETLYIPRVANNDPLYLEDQLVRYEEAIPLEMYLKSFDGFQGDGHFMSNLGVEIRDAVTFTVANTRFMTEIGTPKNWSRPREGDLVYYPFSNACFEIKWVDKFTVHYPLGDLFTYDVRCELFEYSGQIFDTGNPIIDSINDRLSVVDGANTSFNDPLDESDFIQQEGDKILDFSEADPWSEGEF